MALKDKILAAATQTFDVVRCDVCGRWHKFDTDTFIAVYGDVSIGVGKPLLHGNIDEKGKVISSSIFCRTDGCWEKMVKLATEEQKSG